MRQHQAATDLFRRVLELRPDDSHAASRLLDIALSVCDWRQYEAFQTALMARIENDLDAGRPLSVDVFNLQALPLSYELIAKAAKSRAQSIAGTAHGPAKLKACKPKSRCPGGERSGGRRIRLGYALAYTHEHSLPLVLRELVTGHDRSRFEVFGYSIQRCAGTEFSLSYRAAFDHFSDVAEAGPRAAAARIGDDGLDILVDVTGLTSKNCMALMSFRPAPTPTSGQRAMSVRWAASCACKQRSPRPFWARSASI